EQCLPPDLDGVSLLLVEADRGSRTIALARQARALRPEIPCVGVLRWWNEDERELAALVDFILHVPVRPQELDGLTPVALSVRAALQRPFAPRRPTVPPTTPLAFTGSTLSPAPSAPGGAGKEGTMSVSHDQPLTAGGGSARAPMQFGVLQFFSWPNREVPLPTIYARALERIDMMESSGGYEAVWLAEHHFNTYSV